MYFTNQDLAYKKTRRNRGRVRLNLCLDLENYAIVLTRADKREIFRDELFL